MYYNIPHYIGDAGFVFIFILTYLYGSIHNVCAVVSLSEIKQVVSIDLENLSKDERHTLF